MVTTRQLDDEGHEQVLGFHLPGEMIGLDAIHPAKYPCDAVALDTVFVCRFSFPALSTLAANLVTGFAMAMMGPSWSPSWRSPGTGV